MPYGVLNKRRSRLVQKHGSPEFRYVPSDILTTAEDWVSIAAQFPACVKWGPLDRALITNGSDQDITVIINGQETYRIFAGERIEIEKTCWEIRTTNNGAGTVDSGDLEMIFWREKLNADSAVRNAV